MEWNNLSLCTIMFQWMTLNDKKLEYAKFGKVCLNNHTSLSHSNILQRPNQWACFCTKKHLGATLPDTLFHMCKSGQFYLNPT